MVMKSRQGGSARRYHEKKDQVVAGQTTTAEANLEGLRAVASQIVMIHHKDRSIILVVRLFYSGHTKAPRDHISVFGVYIHSMKEFSAFALLGSDMSRSSETRKSELEEQRTALSREDAGRSSRKMKDVEESDGGDGEAVGVN